MQDPTSSNILSGMSADPTDQALQQQIYQQSLAGSAGLLNQISQTNMQAGMNPQIMQAQFAGNQAVLNAGQSMINSPYIEKQSPFMTDPNGIYHQQQSQLLAQGMPQYKSMGVNAYGFDPSAALWQGQMNAYNQQLGQAHFMAAAGMDDKSMSPQELQAYNDAGQISHLNAGQGLLQSVKPMTMVDPNQFLQLAKNQADIAASGNQYRGNLAASAGVMGKQQLENQGKNQVAGTEAAAKIEAANIEAGKPQPPTAVQMEALKSQADLTRTSQLADNLMKNFNPSFFIKGTQLSADGATLIDRATGKPILMDPQTLAQFHGYMNDLNQLATEELKLRGGPRGMSSEVARNQILASLPKPGDSPEEAKANLIEHGSRVLMSAHLNDKLITAAAKQRRIIRPGDAELQAQVQSELANMGTNDLDHVRETMYQRYSNLRPGNQVPPAQQTPQGATAGPGSLKVHPAHQNYAAQLKAQQMLAKMAKQSQPQQVAAAPLTQQPQQGQ